MHIEKWQQQQQRSKKLHMCNMQDKEEMRKDSAQRLLSEKKKCIVCACALHTVQQQYTKSSTENMTNVLNERAT